MRRLLALAILWLALIVGTALADGQGVFLFNTNETGAANTAVTATIGALADQRAHIYRIEAWCSFGTATLDIDTTSQVWTSQTGEVGTTAFIKKWQPGLTMAPNTAVTITLSSCGVSNTGTLIVQADRY